MRARCGGRAVTSRVVATAGHVDHGKSTLVRALTGMEPDRLAEERRRGLTIDLGFAWTRLPSGTDLAFVDVPGHERFVTTMLAGAGPAPAVVMVVAADEGWMPQSAEHLDALDALGVEHGLLVITRCDLLDPEPAREDALAEISSSSLGGVGVVEVCAPRGDGLDALRTALDGLVAAVPEPEPGADVRLWVDRAFSIRGAGTVVTGTLGAGTIRVGDELDLGGRRVHVRGLQSLGEPVQVARGVARVAVNLRGVPREVVARGDALLTPDRWLAPAEVDVALRGVRGGGVLGAEPGALPREVMLHVGSAAVTVRVRPLGSGFARLRPERPLPLRIGDRAVLRDPGRRAVVAGVEVLDVLPPALRRRGAAARRAAELAEPDVGTAAAELRRRGVVRAADLVAMGVPRAEVDALPAVRADGHLVAPARAQEAVSALAAAVRVHDAAEPLDPGLTIEAARRAADLPTPGLVTAVLSAARPGTGAVTPQLRAGRVHLGRASGLPEPVRVAMETLRADLVTHPFRAPDAERLAELGLGPRELAALVRAGELIAVAEGVVLLPEAPDRAVDLLRGVGPEFTLSEARQALGTTRRVAVPLLEHLARTGRTVRSDDLTHRLR
ncbi:selenocysteine-specific elongation factor [Pseudonocardia hierapolitana]|uniref:Selenocysteine-specific elongation factor n=1 Tax=Pseudonocardia hierapolitana TaxID=1128676 RepID=A0A561SH01_9PSEU|nr:selenocysteine-specific translation elongation factor [Pseudonocardia hierapolitana]TWF74142.1 selenocysteine-specific elongation factor [Pseudonocardia hierapolitana]